MPRTPKPPKPTTLSERLFVGAITRFIPRGLLEAAIDATGAREQRTRELPTHTVLYYVILLTLFSELGIREVFRLWAEGFRSAEGEPLHIPQKSALSQARSRVGVAVMRELFRRTARFLAKPKTPGAFFKHWRLVSWDGTCLDVPDTPENERVFGRPGGRNGQGGAFPQVRLAVLAEQGTHVLVDAALGPYRCDERSLARRMLRSLDDGMLLLADRGFISYDLWRDAAETGAHLLWRARQNMVLAPIEEFDDGSYLAKMYPSTPDRLNDTNSVTVRVVQYTLEGGEDPGEVYRVITTLLDPEQAGAEELASLYVRRTEIEFCFDELKTHQRGAQRVLRSRTPRGAVQEVYGYLLAHFAVRGLMMEAAEASGMPPLRMSFTHTVRVVRRTLPSLAGLSPLEAGGMA